jgi:hypothetical protein
MVVASPRMDLDADPIADREGALEAMLAGGWGGIDGAAARAGIEAADENRTGGFGGRSLGFGVIASRDQGDGTNFVVAVTDGDRRGAITARLSGTLMAKLRHEGVDPAEHVVERLQSATGSLPNDGNRYLNIILQDQPIPFHA